MVMSNRALCLILLFLWTSSPASAAKKVADFTGEIDLPRQAATLTLQAGDGSQTKVQFHPTDKNVYQLSAQLKNVAGPFFDISTHLNSDWEIHRDLSGRAVSCIVKLSSQYTLFNRKPVSELSGQFLIREHKVFMNSLVVETLSARGEGDLLAPYPFTVKVQFFEIPLRGVLSLFAPQEGIVAEGNISGDIDFSGTPAALQVKGEISSAPGSIGDWAFRSILLQVEGRYPQLFIRDSLISQSDGMIFKITGAFDLSRQTEWVKQISALQRSAIVDVEGQTSDWTLKRIESGKKSGMTEIRYRLRQNKNVQTMSDENSDLIEILRKVEF